MKRIFRIVLLLSLTSIVCLSLAACGSDSKLTTVSAGDISEIVLNPSSGSKITVTDEAEIKKLVDGFRAVKMTKHKDEFVNWSWQPTVKPSAEKFVTVTLIYKNEKSVTVGSQNSANESFSIYEDASVFKSGSSNSTLTGSIGQETFNKIKALLGQ